MKNVVNKQHGFTLLELVVVVAVMGLIASLATEFVVHESNQARYDLTKERRDNIQTALSNYYDDCSSFPTNLDWLVLKSKVDAVGNTECGNTSNENWAGPYILDVDFEEGSPMYRDGWGNRGVAPEADFGWKYQNSGASVALSTYGLDGAAGQVSNSSSVEYEFERDEGDGYTLLTSPPAGSYYLISVASGAVNVLSCREGAASTGATTVSMSLCI
ncbi:prepilin-type N-terminal cleavage/methylation domain-containing protein [Neptuniibacter sp. SY11_33]|uniref:prepilin-type N-terminal cleavage/methylation domain-containing protein n=1 Tax=Neptuniibacter sp. SY11_33 TaxID=3398215 RepID=UPI0039F5CEFC